MAHYKFVVLTSAVEGREAEYNDWYQNVHLNDVVAVEGITSARRFRLAQVYAGEGAAPYLAIYDIETDNIDAVMAEVAKRAYTDLMPISESMSPEIRAFVYEEFGPLVKAVALR